MQCTIGRRANREHRRAEFDGISPLTVGAVGERPEKGLLTL
jgi:hypothetical protein